MILRTIRNTCLELAAQYPVLTMTGPRQSGKTTLAKSLFPNKPYVNLENPDQRRQAIEDPRAFLKKYPEGAVIDEIQRAPEIPSYLQPMVDETTKKGLFILTGSQQFKVSLSISQSLAGRTGLVKLLPFDFQELQLNEEEDIDQVLFQGFYPRIYQEKLNPYHFFQSYFETYIERDLRQLSQIDNLQAFDKFVRLLAGRCGQLLNLSNLANDLGISTPTLRKWLSLLEASYIVFLLPPFHRNIGKRLIKTPKVFFYDVGLATHLIGIEKPTQLAAHPLRGNLFENMIVIEYLKNRFNQGLSSNLFFFRDRTGHEVDLVMENPLSLSSVEIKSAETSNLEFIKGIQFFRTLFPKTTSETVVYGGKESFKQKAIQFLSWTDLQNH